MLTILPFMVCLFWLIFLLLEWRRDSHALHLFTLFVAVAMLLYLCHAIYFNGFTEISRFSNTLYAFCNIAVYPLYYLYVCRLTQAQKLSLKQWALLIPAFVIGIWAGINLFLFSENTLLYQWQVNVAKVIFVIQLVLVTYFGWKKIRKFDHRIMEFYSYTENRAANMTSAMILILSLCALASIVFSYIGREYFFDRNMVLYIPSLIFSICLYAVCYIGYRQTFTADDMAKDEESAKDVTLEQGIPTGQEGPKNSTISHILSDCHVIADGLGSEDADNQPNDAYESTEYIKVCEMIEQNKWYLRPDLRLPELAILVGIGRTRLSILINENSKMSFSDFINRYRVDYACRILEESAADKDILLKNIGIQSGFMSDSSFYRSFKKITGVTPAQYREKHKA